MASQLPFIFWNGSVPWAFSFPCEVALPLAFATSDWKRAVALVKRSRNLPHSADYCPSFPTAPFHDCSAPPFPLFLAELSPFE